MKNFFVGLLAVCGILSACGQQADKRHVADAEASAYPYEVDSFTTANGKSVELHALVHGSVRIVFDGREIQIDPVHKLGDRTVDYSSMPKADFIFITHEHPDHLDKEAIDLLSDTTTLIIANKNSADILGKGRVMANGDALSLADGMKVETVAAYNTTAGHQQFHPKGRGNGYMLDLDGLRIYIAGDTEVIPEMSALHDIDIAFLPCNQPYTMTPSQLVEAANVVKPKVLFPYHYGDTDLEGIAGQLSADGIDVRIRHYE